MALQPLGIQAIAAGVPNFVRSLGSMDKAIGGVGSRAEGLGRQFVQLGGTVTRFGGVLGTVLVGAAGAAAGALAAIGTIGIREAIQAEEVSARLEAVLRATGGVAGITSEKARELATAYRDLAGGSDDAVLAAEAILLRFKNIRGEAFEPTLQAALDLATVLKIDTASAAEKLGRLLELPGEGLRELRAAGIILMDEQEELIDNLVETGRVAEAQTFLLDALASSIGGTAAIAAQTFSGQLTILRNHILEEAESIGFVLLPAFGRLVSVITPLIEQILPLLVEFFRTRIGPAIQRAVDWIETMIGAFLDAGLFSLEFREALFSILPRELGDRFTEFTDQVAGAFQRVRDFVVDNKDVIISALQGIGAALAAAAIVSTILRIVSILGALTSPIGIILLLVGLLKAAWDTNFLGMRDTLTAFWQNTAQPILQQIGTWLGERLPPVIEAVRGFFERLFGGESQSQVGAFGEAVLGLVERFRPFFEQVGRSFQNLLNSFGIIARGGSLQDAIQGFIDFLTSSVVPAFAVTVELILRTVENLLTVVSNVLDGLAAFWRSHGEEVIAIVGFAFKAVVGTISGILSLIAGVVSAFGALLTGDFGQAFENLLAGLGGFFTSILGITDTNLQDFLGLWDGILDNLAIIISSALQGISDGIAAWIQDISDSIVGGLEAAVESLADFLGLGSPSRLMEAIGQDMMAGLAAGIRGATAMPAVALQASAAQVAGGAGATTNNAFNLTVNSAAPREPVIQDFQMMRALAG